MIRLSNEYEPVQNSQNQNHQLQRFRGWSLTALYYALALWAIMFVIAAVRFWDLLVEQTGGAILPGLLLISSAATFLFSAKAGNQFLRAMRQKTTLPRVDLWPFFLIALTIVVAGRTFAVS